MDNTNMEQQEAKTFTHEELDSILTQRLSRERAKYSDYDELKERAGQVEELRQKAERADQLQAELDKIRIKEMREKVSAATKVPVKMLTGDTEEACIAQANELVAFAKDYAQTIPSYPDIRKSRPNRTPYNHIDSVDEAFDPKTKYIPKDLTKRWK